MKLLAEKNANLEMQDIHGDTPFGELFLTLFLKFYIS